MYTADTSKVGSQISSAPAQRTFVGKEFNKTPYSELIRYNY